MAQHRYTVTGVDLSVRMVEHATAKAARSEVSIAFSVGDAAAPDLPRGGFDVVFARHVVWAIPDPVRALRHWVGLLSQGGRLVLVEGVWFNGVGVSAEDLTRWLKPHVTTLEVIALPDPGLWGGAVQDARYLLVATI